MNRAPLVRALLIVGVTAAAAVSSGLTTAHADPPPSLQQRVDAQLRAYPGGTQTSPNEVAYQAGRVTLTFPDGSRAADPCAAGAYCFYDGKDFTGRKLTFRDCGGWQYLTDYGFGNKTTSWDNNTKNQVLVYDENISPRKQLWTENADTASANVGSTADNKADSFLTYCP